MDALVDLGLGLGKHELRVARTTPAWVDAGASLRGHIAALLGAAAARVEHVGSTSVEGLLAKPIIDLAVGVTDALGVETTHDRLVAARWIYRGDGGDEGGHFFVLETQPRLRIAHLHVVDHNGIQWNNYLRLRAALCVNPAARAAYESTKLQLIGAVGVDREAYTNGKTDVIRAILDSGPPSEVR